MLLRLAAISCIALTVVACNSNVSCPTGETENDAGVCEEIPKDSSTSSATESDSAAPRDGAISPMDARSDAATVARDDASTNAIDSRSDGGSYPDGGEIASADADAAQDGDAAVTAGDPSDAAASSADAAPACVPSTETCNGKDDDCDTLIDEEVSEAPIGESCSNGGQSVCAMTGMRVCLNGAIICNAPPPTPQPELCDGIDNDCMNGADDTFPEKTKACTVGTGDCANTGVNECDPADPTKLRCSVAPKTSTCGSSCTPPPTSECSAGTGDCKGTAAWTCDGPSGTWRCPAVAKPVTCAATGSCSPLPAETCGDNIDNDCKNGVDDGCCVPTTEVCGDTLDNDCDGMADEGCVLNACGGWGMLPHAAGASCSVIKAGGCSYPATYVCDKSYKDLTVCNGPPPAETCDYVDNDCDGMVDEGLTNVCGGCGSPQPTTDKSSEFWQGPTFGAKCFYWWNNSNGECVSEGVVVCQPGANTLVCNPTTPNPCP